MRLLRSSLLALFLAPALASSAAGGEPPKTKPAPQTKNESLDDILGSANAEHAEAAQGKAPAAAPAEDKKPATAPAATDAGKPAAETGKPAAAPAEPAAPPTDDNDATAEASAPKPLAAVQPTNEVRRRGPYELGPLDCRVLDGAGIERLLPKRIVSGEEPDLLCRVQITQPANVVTVPHSLTVTVNVGERETFRQARNVRISSVGRRALVFIIPSDKISSDDPATVHVRAMLSAPATPGGGRDVSFVVESED